MIRAHRLDGLDTLPCPCFVLKHAFELLSQPPQRTPDVVAVFGNDSTLRAWATTALSGDGDRTSFDGDTVKWTDLRDDLSTASLFDAFDDGDKRTIVVRGADDFLSKHRPEIEKYLAKPVGASRLILELESLASNTRIYKAIDKQFLLVGCGNAIDSKKGVTAASRRKFIGGYVAPKYQCKIDKDAIDALFDLLGDDVGMVETEVAKLALYREPGGTIDVALVDDVVSGWQGKTVWQITDAIAAGDAAEAIRQLDKLILGGLKPIALLPQIAWSLRRLAMATAVVRYLERSGRNWRLKDAVAAAGVNRPGDIENASRQLKTMGRDRASQLLPWLLDADLRLKGTHSAEPRDRFMLEQLVLRLAKGG